MHSGIGYALATQMLQHAVSTNQPKVVILACRSMARAEKARHGILQQVYPASALAEDQKGVYAVSPSESVQIVHLDLASPKSVFQACTEIRSRYNATFIWHVPPLCDTCSIPLGFRASITSC